MRSVQRCAVLSLIFLVAAEPADVLVGRWEEKNEFVRTTWTFLPGGRMKASYQVAGVEPSSVEGRYTLEGRTLRLELAGGPPQDFEIELSDDKTVLAFEGVRRFIKVAGEQEVAADQAKGDERQRTEDAEWRKRFPVAPIRPGPTPAVGDVPADPRPDDHFAGATVFAQLQSYVWFSQTQLPLKQPGPGDGRSYTRYHFYPTGRVWADSVLWQRSGNEQATFTRVSKWGKYKISSDPGPEETASISFDDGESETMALAHGRRNLRGTALTLGNVTWEQWALDRHLGKSPAMPPVPDADPK